MTHITRTKPTLPKSAWGRGDLTPPNIPDYENNLAFAPRVTYRDVRKHAQELAKKKDLSFYFRAGWFSLGNLWVYNTGRICTGLDDHGIKVKSFERIKTIIDNLYGD